MKNVLLGFAAAVSALLVVLAFARPVDAGPGGGTRGGSASSSGCGRASFSTSMSWGVGGCASGAAGGPSRCRSGGPTFSGGSGGSPAQSLIAELCKVRFEEATPSEPGKFVVSGPSKDAAVGPAGRNDADAPKRPTLAYYCVREAAGGDRALVTHVVACRSLEDRLFNGRSTSVGLLARSFRCVRVDVSSVTPQGDRVYNRFNAPLVRLDAADGSRVALLSGSIDEGQLIGAMLAALQKSGLNGTAIIVQGEPLLRQIQQLERDRDRIGRKASQAGRNAQGGADDGRAKTELAQIEQALAEAYRALGRLGTTGSGKPASGGG